MDMDKRTYAKILHARLSHLQLLLAGLYALLVSVIAAAMFGSPTAPASGAVDGAAATAPLQPPIHVLLALFVLFWSHLFALYQAGSSCKAINILTCLEGELKLHHDLCYFHHDLFRKVFYLLVHLFPSALLLLFLPAVLIAGPNLGWGPRVTTGAWVATIAGWTFLFAWLRWYGRFIAPPPPCPSPLERPATS